MDTLYRFGFLDIYTDPSLSIGFSFLHFDGTGPEYSFLEFRIRFGYKKVEFWFDFLWLGTWLRVVMEEVNE
jgi:hypothetical protein